MPAHRLATTIACIVLCSFSLAPGAELDAVCTAVQRHLDADPKPDKAVFEADLLSLQELLDNAPADVLLLIAKGRCLGALDRAKEAIAPLAKATQLAPENHEAWACYGNALFESIGETQDLSALSTAKEGRDAYEKAIALKSDDVQSRWAVCQFYVQAPGIAGGSYSKARAHAKALFALPDNKGEFMAHMILASVAVNDEKWKDAAREFEAARTARGEGAGEANAVLSASNALVLKAKKPDLALPFVERACELAPENPSVWFWRGECARMKDDCAAAICFYERVLSINARALNTTFALAGCLEKTGEPIRAAEVFESFAAQFPDDKRADDAARSAKRLRR